MSQIPYSGYVIRSMKTNNCRKDGDSSLSASEKMFLSLLEVTSILVIQKLSHIFPAPLGGFLTSNLHSTATNTDRSNTKLGEDYELSTELLLVKKWNL